MPTIEEITAATSALTVSIGEDQATLEALEAAAARAKSLEDTATAIEAAGFLTVGLQGDRVKVSAPAFVSQVVASMRARATAIRDAVTLPA